MFTRFVVGESSLPQVNLSLTLTKRTVLKNRVTPLNGVTRFLSCKGLSVTHPLWWVTLFSSVYGVR